MLNGAKFNAKSFHNRETSLSSAMREAGLKRTGVFAKVPKAFILGRRKDDTYNTKPSIGVILNVN